MKTEDRARKSAKSYLISIVFRESSLRSTELADTSLLATVGYYYSGFHLSMSLLWLHNEVMKDELTHIKHAQLRKLIDQKLIQSKTISRKFMNIFKKLQECREYANYIYCERIPDPAKYENPDELYSLTEEMLDIAHNVIYQKLNNIDELFTFQSYIGDHAGDDLIRNHCGKELAEKVSSYIVGANLST